jgi:hypothetical protein
VSWLANEHKILEQSLGRRFTAAEHRAHVHAFIDMVFDDEEKILADAAARAAAAAAAKVVPFVPSPAQRWLGCTTNRNGIDAHAVNCRKSRCAQCAEGKVIAARVADHIEPHHNDPVKF